VQGTFLEKEPVISLSSTTGQGLPELLSSLDTIVAEIKERPSSGTLRLPIDRVFTMKGFGTVVTGTLMAGTVSLGDEVEILPVGVSAKVRGIQVHNESVETVGAGVRTAINLQGTEKSQIERGEVLAAPGTALPTKRVDASVDYLAAASRPLKNRTRIRFHSGTAEVMGEVRVLAADELLPGQSGFIQILLEQPVVLFPHDRYVLRSYSPVDTVGGGEILDNLPPRHKRTDAAIAGRMQILQQADPGKALAVFCKEAGLRGLTAAQIQSRLGLETSRQQALVEKLIAAGQITAFSREPFLVADPQAIRELEQLVQQELKDFHAKNPLKQGMLREELRARLPYDTSEKLFSRVIENLVEKNKIGSSKEYLFLAGRSPVLLDAQKDLQKKILDACEKGSLTPPTVKELAEKLHVVEKILLSMLEIGVREGSLVKVSEELYFNAAAISKLTGDVVAYLEKNGEITTQGFKDLTGLSRKFMIPLFEYLDRAKVTVRIGDKRVLRKVKSER
jgi:selenocysteine-specific elongation factor